MNGLEWSRQGFYFGLVMSSLILTGEPGLARPIESSTEQPSAAAVPLSETLSAGVEREAIAQTSITPPPDPGAPVFLPPPEDTPEEVLRAQILLEGRSPRTGRPLSAADYAQLQAQLEAQLRTTAIAPDQFRAIVFQLSILRGLRLLLPFLP